MAVWEALNSPSPTDTKKSTATYKITPEKDPKTSRTAPPQQRTKGLHQDLKDRQSILKNPTLSMTKYDQEDLTNTVSL